MSTFVHIVSNAHSNFPWPRSGDKAHADYINEILTKLQQKGAKITSVTASIDVNHSSPFTQILYVIAYDAPAAIAI